MIEELIVRRRLEIELKHSGGKKLYTTSLINMTHLSNTATLGLACQHLSAPRYWESILHCGRCKILKMKYINKKWQFLRQTFTKKFTIIFISLLSNMHVHAMWYIFIKDNDESNLWQLNLLFSLYFCIHSQASPLRSLIIIKYCSSNLD